MTATVDKPATTSLLVRSLRSTFATGATRSLSWRLAQLDGIERFCDEQEDAIAEAMASDLGLSLIHI